MQVVGVVDDDLQTNPSDTFIVIVPMAVGSCHCVIVARYGCEVFEVFQRSGFVHASFHKHTKRSMLPHPDLSCHHSKVYLQFPFILVLPYAY